MSCPVWMHPPDVDLRFCAQPYLSLCMPRHSPMPPGTCSRRLSWAASFGSLLPFSALCQEVCPCGNPPVSCPVNCTQLIIPASHSIRARLNLVSLPVSFTAGVEMVQKFSAPESRMIIYACRVVGLTSDRLLRGCHLTIRFSTIASVAMSSSSPTTIIFVSNLFFNPCTTTQVRLLHRMTQSHLRAEVP